VLYTMFVLNSSRIHRCMSGSHLGKQCETGMELGEASWEAQE
jgi:hypothetical protein